MKQEDFEEQARLGECPVCAAQTKKAEEKSIDNFKNKVEQAQEVDRGKML